MNEPLLSEQERVTAIDRARGMLVFAMVFFQMAERFPGLGLLAVIASHRTDTGIYLFSQTTLADIVMPAFLLMIALNYGPSFRRRVQRDGQREACRHFVTRYVSIIAVGGAIRAIQLFARYPFWSWYNSAHTITAALFIVSAVCWQICRSLHASEKKVNLFRRITLVLLYATAAGTVILSAYNGVYVYFTADYNIFFQSWGVLPVLGLCGLALLPMIKKSSLFRACAGVVSLAVLTAVYVHPKSWNSMQFDKDSGVIGTFGWLAALLFYSVLADLYWRDRTARKNGVTGWRAETYTLGAALFAAVGAAAACLLPVVKAPISPGFVLYVVGLIPVLFRLVMLTDSFKPKCAPLLWFGRSPIVIYILQFLLNDCLMTLFSGAGEWPVWLGALVTAAYTAVMTFIAYRLYRRKTAVRL